MKILFFENHPGKNEGDQMSPTKFNPQLELKMPNKR